MPGLGISKIPGSYKCYVKKSPQTQPARKRRANLAMTPDGDVSANTTFTSHRRTHTGLCRGHADPSSATEQPRFGSFTLAKSGSVLKRFGAGGSAMGEINPFLVTEKLRSALWAQAGSGLPGPAVPTQRRGAHTSSRRQALWLCLSWCRDA